MSQLLIAQNANGSIDFARALWDLPYYAENLLCVKTKSQGLQRLKFNQAQNLLWYGRPKDYNTNPLYRHAVIPECGWQYKTLHGLPILDVILKYRQGGISTGSVSLAFQKVHTNFAKKAMIVAHDKETSEHLLEMAKTFYDYLPPEWQPKLANKNAREMVFADPKGGTSLRSSISIETAGHTGSGHGRTCHVLVASELARWECPEYVLDGLLETVPTGVDSPGTAIVFESTAEWASDYFYNAYHQARSGDSGYEAVFLPWYLCEWYRESAGCSIPFPKEYREMQAEYGLDADQLTWYINEIGRQNIKRPGRGEKFVRRLYPATEDEAFITAGLSVYSEEALDYLKLKTRRPIAEGEIQAGKIVWKKGGRLKIWEKPRSDSLYLIGADVGLGVGRSQSAVEVFAHPGYRQVGEWASEHVDPRAFAHVIKPIGEYFGNATVAVEINNAGVLTNSELENVYGYVYKWKYFNRTKALRTQATGWNTTHDTKTIMVHHMCSLLNPSPPQILIRSPELLSQMRLFQEYPGDKYQPAPGSRGDLNMAALIACVCLYQEYARHDMEYFLRGYQEEKEEGGPRYKWKASTDDWDPGAVVQGPESWMNL